MTLTCPAGAFGAWASRRTRCSWWYEGDVLIGRVRVGRRLWQSADDARALAGGRLPWLRELPAVPGLDPVARAAADWAMITALAVARAMATAMAARVLLPVSGRAGAARR